MVSRTKLRMLAMGLTATALVVAPAMSASAGPTGPRPVVTASGKLKDLAATPDATDGARARFVAVATPLGTRSVLVVTGLAPAAVGSTLGAHIHVGPCVAGQPLAAGPHYNSGGPADASHEIWLDFTVLPGGVGVADSSVPFTIAPGAARSLVIHAMATGPGGIAGPRLACLPVTF